MNANTSELQYDPTRTQSRAFTTSRMWSHTPRLARAFAHLAACAGVTLGDAFMLKIGSRTYSAVRYEQNGSARLFVLGTLPASYLRNPGGMYTPGLHYAFNVKDCERAAGALGGVWYIAGHSNAQSEQLARTSGHLWNDSSFLLFKSEGEALRVKTCEAQSL